MADKRDKWLGLHEQLDTPALREKLAELGLDDLAVWQRNVDADELPGLRGRNGILGAAGVDPRPLRLREVDTPPGPGGLPDFVNLRFFL